MNVIVLNEAVNELRSPKLISQKKMACTYDRLRTNFSTWHNKGRLQPSKCSRKDIALHVIELNAVATYSISSAVCLLGTISH